MIKVRNFFISVAVLSAPVFILTAQAANNLDDLLKETRSVRDAENQQAQTRMAQYNAASATDKDRLMKEATAQRDDRAAVAKSLSDKYSANEIKVNEMNDQLRKKAAAMGISEVFGLAKQVASDVATILQQSLITAQLKPVAGEESRDKFLRQFAESKSVPTAAELERVWLEIQREMTESGKVARFNADIIQPNGNRATATAIRVGPFTAVSDTKYLGYLPALESLDILARQPTGKVADSVKQLRDAKSGYVPTVVDPTRGVLLAMYVERPSLIERINRGETTVAYTILTVGAAGVLAFIVQLFYLIIARYKLSWQLRNLNTPSRDNPLGRVLLAFKVDPARIEEDADLAELRISEAVLHEVPKLERVQSFLRLAVAAGPLLGLIGTVVGMIITFQSITETGSSDPKLMAHGIGTAMIATVLGLGIAIPLLFANALLTSLSRGMVQILDERSAGLLAESIEKRRRA